ncbi:MAG TPA: hypothetical protein VMF50_08760 [Candidatus Binataceae bacterium]|nr:hypothetical protein [Candidatus Binataceae bacterium]
MKALGKSLAAGLLGSMMLAFPAIPVMAQAAPAQQGQAQTTPITIQRGNTEIEFQSAASNPDLNLRALQDWGNFAQTHPDVARELAYRPRLMSNSAYLRKHPDLANFFTSHPEIKDAMAENPGNFIPVHPGR